jgi:hypothetical protein
MSKVAGLYASKGEVGFTPLPAGDYLIEAHEPIDEAVSSNGNPQYILKSTVIDDAKGTGEFEGRKYTEYFTVSEKQFTIDKLKNMLNAFGVEVTKVGNFDNDSIMGKQAWVTLAIENDDKGKERNRSREYFPVED